jgi:lipopolysaccharide heptosyltransferase II
VTTLSPDIMPKPLDLGQSPSFLIIRRRYVGDIVLLTPLLRAIVKRYPRAQIDVVVDSPYRDLLLQQPEIRQLRILPYHAGFLRGLRHNFSFYRELRKASYDVILDLSQNDRSQLVCRLARGTHKLTWEITGRTIPKRHIYTQTVCFPEHSDLEIPVSEIHQALLVPFDISPDSAPAQLTVTEDEKERARQWLKNHLGDQKPVFIHPGTRSEARRWPADRFAEITRRLVEAGFPVILIGGPGDATIVQAIHRLSGRVAQVAPIDWTLRQVLAAFSEGQALIAHDSGPMHLAIATQLPVIALFGSQPIHVWAPSNANALYLQSPQPCTDCLYPDKCVVTDSYRTYCVQKLSIDYVWNKIHDFLT